MERKVPSPLLKALGIRGHQYTRELRPVQVVVVEVNTPARDVPEGESVERLMTGDDPAYERVGGGGPRAMLAPPGKAGPAAPVERQGRWERLGDEGGEGDPSRS